MTALAEPSREPGACEHFAACSSQMRKEMLTRYRKYATWAAGMDMVPIRALRLRKPSYPSCVMCKLSILRPTMCLECDTAYCRAIPTSMAKNGPTSAGGSSRAPPGSQATAGRGLQSRMAGCGIDHVAQSGHSFTLDTSSGTIYCHSCADYIYPEGIVVTHSRTKRVAEERAGGSLIAAKRAKFNAWKVTDGAQTMLDGLAKLRCHGLRPLLNLSQTCFLSAVLQALLNNPLFRSYYLSDKHNRLSCEARRAAIASSIINGANGSSSAPVVVLDEDAEGERDSDAGSVVMNGNGHGNVAVSSLREGECMSCEMDVAFDMAYSEDSTPWGPASMLFATWKASDELAGYAQQDAHAFFLAALNQLHAHSPERAEPPQNCRCAAHQAFSGSLLSTVTCAKCDTSTKTVEPLLDINLELKGTSIPGKEVSRPELRGGVALADCLKRYTGKEALSHRSYECANCKSETVGATKQLSIKKLPATLAIQLKRFEHSVDKTSKVDTMVHFPTNLDMRPYTSDILHKAKGVTIDLPTEMYQYQLSAVITHEGKLDNGHYWADVRSGYEWFRCDDEKVTNTTLASVLTQRAYMLFYVKKTLAYEQEPPNLPVNV